MSWTSKRMGSAPYEGSGFCASVPRTSGSRWPTCSSASSFFGSCTDHRRLLLKTASGTCSLPRTNSSHAPHDDTSPPRAPWRATRPRQSFSSLPAKLPTTNGQPSFWNVASPSSPDQLRMWMSLVAAATRSRAEVVSGRS